jgi:hypothetical protein
MRFLREMTYTHGEGGIKGTGESARSYHPTERVNPFHERHHDVGGSRPRRRWVTSSSSTSEGFVVEPRKAKKNKNPQEHVWKRCMDHSYPYLDAILADTK